MSLLVRLVSVLVYLMKFTPASIELPTTLQATLYVRWDFLAIITDITNYFCAVRQMSGLCQAHFPVLNGCQVELPLLSG